MRQLTTLVKIFGVMWLNCNNCTTMRAASLVFTAQAVRKGGPIVGLIALVLATGLLWVTSVFAQNFTAFETGDELIDVCNVPTLDPRHFNDLCAGYISGVSDVLNSQGTICTPKEATVHQTVDVILNYLREHPEQRSMAAPVLTRAALGKAFPCN